MAYDDVITRNEDGELAVRTISATESATVVNPNDVYTRDSDGNLAIRVVGAGGDSHNLGYYATLEDLQEAHPTAEAGDWAIVGSTDTVWVWDEEESAWTDTDKKGQVTSVNNQTGAVVLDAEDVGAIPQVASLPVASAETEGAIVQLTTDGYFYKCTGAGDPAVYSWGRINVQPAPVIPDSLEQWDSLPTASADYLDVIVQYVGTTGGGLTNGYIYKCTTDGVDYAWTQYDVQPTPVRSVNGLTGDVVLSTYLPYPNTWVTTASYTTSQFCASIAADTTATVGKAYLGEVNLSDLPASLSNGEVVVEIMSGTTAANKVIVLTLTSGNASPYMWKYTYWDNGSSVSGWVGFQPELVSGTNIKTINNTTLLGSGNITIDVPQTASLPTASATELGRIYQYTGATDSSYTNGYFYKCVSDGATPTPNYSWARVDVQPNAVTSVNNQTGAITLTPSDIGATAMSVPATMPTLAVVDWNNSSQTVQVAGVTATNTVFVAPAPASADDYSSAGIVCVAQGAGSLTFTCDTVPSNAITVNVVIFN